MSLLLATLEDDPLQQIAMGTTKHYSGDKNGACKDWNTAIGMDNITDDSRDNYLKFINENCNWKYLFL